MTALEMDQARVALHRLVDELPDESLAVATRYVAAIRAGQLPGSVPLVLRPELRELWAEEWSENAEAYRYLAEH